MEVSGTSMALTINAPELFACADFRAWLNSSEPKFTCHQSGDPGEWSDVIVLVDPGLGGEGSDSDAMPGWDHVVELVRTVVTPKSGCDHIVVRLTNLD